MKKFSLITTFVIIFFLSACKEAVSVEPSGNQVISDQTFEQEASSPLEVTQEFNPTVTPNVSSVYLAEDDLIYSIWISEFVPKEISFEILKDQTFKLSDDESGSDLRLELEFLRDGSSDGEIMVHFSWVYALAAAFPVLQDDMSITDLKNIWKGNPTDDFTHQRIFADDKTFQIFTALWGRPDKNTVRVVDENDLLEAAWEDQTALVILPFENITPRWKVISVNGVSPIHNDYSSKNYSLEVEYILSLQNSEMEEPKLSTEVPLSNRDADKLTSLVMSGTTALVRYTAQRMEVNGVNYPAEDILPWLLDADLTHISNEVSFYPDCPPADPVRREQRFCSSPDYYELLEYIDVDIVELTGNHILDWGVEPFLYTLNLYKENKLPYFGGGINLSEARQPLLVQHNGNSLYFIGCSPAGPENVWATEDTAGSNPCDNDWLQAQINFANQNGYIPIVTFQHWEVEDYRPHSSQRVDFLNAAKLGAAIVSGSQSHFPQSMTIFGDTFIHFGLGNLFFDQMYGDNPREFIDRHVFYNGKYINTELLTAMLEDYAKPRPMTDTERKEFLEDVFTVCNWEMKE